MAWSRDDEGARLRGHGADPRGCVVGDVLGRFTGKGSNRAPAPPCPSESPISSVIDGPARSSTAAKGMVVRRAGSASRSLAFGSRRGADSSSVSLHLMAPGVRRFVARKYDGFGRPDSAPCRSSEGGFHPKARAEKGAPRRGNVLSLGGTGKALDLYSETNTASRRGRLLTPERGTEAPMVMGH